MKKTVFIFGVLITLVSSAVASKNCERYLEQADKYLATAHNPLNTDEKKSYNANIAAATLLRYKICLTERPKAVKKDDYLGELISEKERAFRKEQWNKVK